MTQLLHACEAATVEEPGDGSSVAISEAVARDVSSSICKTMAMRKKGSTQARFTLKKTWDQG
tara:strand:- start:801 stop:986 length:186 start_codon:yes stop_codon:yes gene_type:complete